MRSRDLAWALPLAAVPLAAAGVVAVVARSGRLMDPTVTVTLGATRSDWLLALGAVATLVAALAVLAVLAASRRRRAAARATEAATSAVAAEAAEQRRLLLSRLDHELKNPLTAMRAAAANLGDTGELSIGAPGLRSIEEQVLRLSRLTADLRKLADLETAEIEHLPVDVEDLVLGAVEAVHEHDAARGRAIAQDVPRVPWPIPPVVGDRDLLELALVNLLDNAVKFTRPGDRIEVRARDAGSHVVIEVADTGPGIDAHEVDHIWEELYRGSATRWAPGSGLGLPLVRAVAERHGGEASVTSRPGVGSAFRLSLPVFQGVTRP